MADWPYTPEQVFNAIYGGETGYGQNSRTSPQGAVGPMQIMPATFRQWARPGESINNPDDNRAVAMRMITSYMQQYGGDPGRVAAAYFSGPGNVAPANSAAPYIKNFSDVNEPTSKYVANVMAKLGQPARPVTSAGAAPPPPDAYGYASSTPNALAGTPPIAAAPIASASPAPLGQGGIGSDYAASARNIPGTTINSNPIASLGGKIGDLATNLQKDLGKSDDDKAQPKPEIKPDIPPAPGARNISPLLGNPQIYAQRMAGLNQPMTWGSAPPGQNPWTGYGIQTQPSVYGTSLMSQMLNDPTWMDQMAGGGSYG